MEALISVVIPVYNSEQTIIQCIDSVIEDLKTTPYTWDITLVDDGSMDHSAQIIQSYINKSPYKAAIKLITQANGGAASARNTGIKSSSGTYIAFNDSDDIWIQGKTKSQMEYLLNNPHIDMICGAHEVPYRPIFKKLKEYTRITIKDVIFQNFCSPPTTIIKRNILQKTGLFDDSMRTGGEEGSLFLPLTYYGCCMLHNKVVARSITNKRKWGDSGLSGNIVGMERGRHYNMKKAYQKRLISFPLYLAASGFAYIKFIRRLIIKQIIRFI